MARKKSIDDLDAEELPTEEPALEKVVEKRPTDEQRKLTRKRLEHYFERKQLREQIDYDPLADNDELTFEEEEGGGGEEESAGESE